jgi:hypothetical protein
MRLLLDVQLILEDIRLQHLRANGYFPSPVLPSDSRAKALSGLLSTSYYTILEFHNVHVPILMKNAEFLATYADSLPSSWYSFDMLETLRATLENGIGDASYDPLAMFKLLSAHSNLGIPCSF